MVTNREGIFCAFVIDVHLENSRDSGCVWIHRQKILNLNFDVVGFLSYETIIGLEYRHVTGDVSGCFLNAEQTDPRQSRWCTLVDPLVCDRIKYVEGRRQRASYVVKHC